MVNRYEMLVLKEYNCLVVIYNGVCNSENLNCVLSKWWNCHPLASHSLVSIERLPTETLHL